LALVLPQFWCLGSINVIGVAVEKIQNAVFLALVLPQFWCLGSINVIGVAVEKIQNAVGPSIPVTGVLSD